MLEERDYIFIIIIHFVLEYVPIKRMNLQTGVQSLDTNKQIIIK